MKKLAVTQMVLGALIVASVLGFSIWVEPHLFGVLRSLPHEAEAGDITNLVLIMNMPVSIWRAVTVVLGISVLGCGIVQYFKTRWSGEGTSRPIAANTGRQD